jgi:hypothetical protein
MISPFRVLFASYLYVVSSPFSLFTACLASVSYKKNTWGDNDFPHRFGEEKRTKRWQKMLQHIAEEGTMEN